MASKRVKQDTQKAKQSVSNAPNKEKDIQTQANEYAELYGICNEDGELTAYALPYGPNGIQVLRIRERENFI